MQTKVQKWGNSLGVRLPAELAKRQSLTAGSVVEFEETDDTIAIRVSKPKPETLEELVAQITPENRHEEVDWGEPRGAEVW